MERTRGQTNVAQNGKVIQICPSQLVPKDYKISCITPKGFSDKSSTWGISTELFIQVRDSFTLIDLI